MATVAITYMYNTLLYEAVQVPEIVLYMCYNKPVKVQLTLMHYGKILHAGMVSSTRLHVVLY